MRWSRIVLVVLMVIDVWYRAHTFGPDIRAATGLNLWPQAIGDGEPLDCDEAAYAYMGHRVLRGDALYRDLTEYKPPLGYWIYTMAVAVGGYTELAIRLMVIPFVLATIAAVWWIAMRLGGPVAAALAAGLYVLLSTDPFLFGNGSNMEHFINLFAILSLALMIRAWDRYDPRWMFAAGVCLGAAALVKQVALAHAIVFVPALFARAWADDAGTSRRVVRGLIAVLAFSLGVSAIVAVASTIVVARGAGPAAYEDIVLQARALATDTLPDPTAPSPAIRWLTGNADLKGELPWPFGSTDYLVWWATGSWPVWMVSVPALIYLVFGAGSDARRRLAAGWTVAAWLQVTLPGLYWQHYYLLPTPGVSIAVAVALADAIAALKPPTSAAPRRRSPAAVAAVLLTLAVVGMAVLESRYYLGVPPRELTARYKGGRQWIALREMGRDLARRAANRDDTHLYVWGWQSPLYFYSRLDSPTRHFFVDNLLRDQAGRNHPLIGPRVAEIIETLRSRPPELILTGYAPFPALRTFLSDRYLPSRWALGLWIRRDLYARFETTPSSTTDR